MKKHRKDNLEICIVEDNENFRDALTIAIKKYGNIQVATDYEEGLDAIKMFRPDILFVDLNLKGEKNGPLLIKEASKLNIYCVVVSSYKDERTIDKCFLNGAKDYVVKDNCLPQLADVIEKYKRLYKRKNGGNLFLSNNKEYLEKLNFVLDYSSSPYSILITGPTGSGKTHFAKIIHEKSKFKGNLVSLNCSAIAKDLFESEMFGHVKGSFSGAEGDYMGKVLQAKNGTLYLDEIDSMPLSQQAKLLKVLEDKEFYPVGSNKLVASNFRLVCSTQKNLKNLVDEGKFREDLYHRINFLSLDLLPLEDRPEDIIDILKQLLKGSRRYKFDNSFVSEIQKYRWPGNIRELNTFATILKLNSEGILTKEYFYKIYPATIKSKPVLNKSQIDLIDKCGLEEFLETMKDLAFEYVLNKNNGEAVKTINSLKISNTMYYSWKKKNIDKIASGNKI